MCDMRAWRDLRASIREVKETRLLSIRVFRFFMDVEKLTVLEVVDWREPAWGLRVSVIFCVERLERGTCTFIWVALLHG